MRILGSYLEEMKSRSGIFPEKLTRELSLFWVIEMGPMISSVISHNNIVYNSTITGRIFAIDIYKKKIIWQKELRISFSIIIITL